MCGDNIMSTYVQLCKKHTIFLMTGIVRDFGLDKDQVRKALGTKYGV